MASWPTTTPPCFHATSWLSAFSPDRDLSWDVWRGGSDRVNIERRCRSIDHW